MPTGRRLFGYARKGFTFRVYRDQLQIRVLGPLRPSVTVHALADVVDVRRIGAYGLRLRLVDGTEVTYQVGTAADEVQALLAQLL